MLINDLMKYETLEKDMERNRNELQDSVKDNQQ